MKVKKAITQVVFGCAFALLLSCTSVSNKKVEQFAIKLTEDFINRDSISLYNKQIDGEIAGEWGLLFYYGNADVQEMKTPKELIELSKQRRLESKKDELRRLSNLVNGFNNSFDSKIISISTDTLDISEGMEVTNLLNRRKKKQFKSYQVRQVITTEKGDITYFRPGLIIQLGNNLYYWGNGVKISDEKFYRR